MTQKTIQLFLDNIYIITSSIFKLYTYNYHKKINKYIAKLRKNNDYYYYEHYFLYILNTRRNNIYNAKFVINNICKDIIVKIKTNKNILFEFILHSYLRNSHTPKLYFLCKINNSFCIGFEKLHGTLWDFFDMFIDNESILIQNMLQIIKIIHNLQKQYKFMHRDFHPGNIMYMYQNNTYTWYIVDLEFSILEIKGIMLSNITETKHYRLVHSFNPSHDLRLLILALFGYYKKRLPSTLFLYFIDKLSYVSYYLDDKEEMFFHNAYMNVVDNIDSNFIPEHMIYDLENIQSYVPNIKPLKNTNLGNAILSCL